MKRLLTKTLCLQAILFMGVAFSTSCTPSSNSSSEPELVVNSTKTALQYMNTKKNYTITYSGARLVQHQYIYTDNIIGRYSSAKESLNYYYYSDEGGTFQIEYNEYMIGYLSSEYRSTENVWNTDLTFNFYGVGTSFINGLKDDDTEVRVKNNELKRTFIQLLGYTAADFMNIDSLTAKYADDVLTFTCMIGSKDYVYKVSNFGTTEATQVKELKSSVLHAYTPAEVLISSREKIYSNNYIQGIYYIDTTGGGYVGNYLFNPHYFGQTYTSSADMNGYISLNCPAEEGDNAHPALKGCYYYYISNYASTSPTPSINSNAISENPDIVEVMNYPSHLLLWSNFQRFTKWTGDSEAEITGKGYYTQDEELLIDFSNNFNMDSSFEGQTPYAIGMDANISGESTDSVIFYYYFKYGTTIQCYPIPFYSFGQANVKILDQIYNTYHTIDN